VTLSINNYELGFGEHGCFEILQISGVT